MATKNWKYDPQDPNRRIRKKAGASKESGRKAEDTAQVKRKRQRQKWDAEDKARGAKPASASKAKKDRPSAPKTPKKPSKAHQWKH